MKGDTVTWKARHFGIWQKLTVQITAMEFPSSGECYFADKMLKGAFKSMHHIHHFKKEGSGTLMIDEFHFEAPFGFLGRIADKLFLEDYMTKFLVERNNFLKQECEKK